MFENKAFHELEKKIALSKNKDLDRITFVYENTRKIKTAFGQAFSDRKRFPKSESPALIAVLCTNPHSLHETYRNGFIIPVRNGIYAYKLEREFSNDNFIKFRLENSDYLFGNIGISKAANFYFKKNLSELNEDEMIILVLMLENPSLYNPIRHPERVEKKLKLYRQYLHNQTAGNTR
jgi:hypothetical protein